MYQGNVMSKGAYFKQDEVCSFNFLPNCSIIGCHDLHWTSVGWVAMLESIQSSLDDGSIRVLKLAIENSRGGCISSA